MVFRQITAWLAGLMLCAGVNLSARAQGLQGDKVEEYLQKQHDVLTSTRAQPEEKDAAAENIAGTAEYAAQTGLHHLAARAWVIFGHHVREKQPAQAQRAFVAAEKWARLGGDVESELKAMDGRVALMLTRDKPDNAHIRDLRGLLEQELDLAAASDLLHMLFVSLTRFEKVQPPMYKGAAAVIAMKGVSQIDQAASLQLNGKTAELEKHINAAFGNGLPLWAAGQAERLGAPDLLRKAIAAYQKRGDARGELRATLLLVDDVSDGPGGAELRTAAYAAAQRAGDWRAMADLAPTPEAAAHAARMAALTAPPPVSAAVKSEVWRGPSEPSDFTEAFRAALSSKNSNDRQEAVLLAHADASPASLPVFFEALANDEQATRRNAARAIEELADESHFDQIAAAARHNDFLVRSWMIIKLASFARTNPRVQPLLKELLAQETADRVKVLLQAGLIESGEIEPHLSALQAKVMGRSDWDPMIVASGALYRLGFFSPVANITMSTKSDAPGHVSHTAAEFAALSDRPGAAALLDHLEEKRYLSFENFGYAMNRLRTPEALALRNRQRDRNAGFIATNPAWGAWLYLRDARRGNLRYRDAELLHRATISASSNAAGDVVNWMVTEEAGLGQPPAESGPPVDDNRDSSPGVRRMARSIAKRPPPARPSEGQRVRLTHNDGLNMMVMEGRVNPIAVLEGATLRVDPNLEARHHAAGSDLFSALFVEFEAVLAAQDFIKEMRLDGLPGGELKTDGSGVFHLAGGVAGDDLRAGNLIIKCQIFNAARELKFPLAKILVDNNLYKPDLVVEAVKSAPPRPRPGEEVEVVATVRNLGNREAASTAVSFYVHNMMAPEGRRGWAGFSTAPALKPGETADVLLLTSYDPGWYMNALAMGWSPGNGDTNLEAVVDEDQRVAELDERNNALKQPIDLLLTGDEQTRLDEARLYARLNKYMNEAQATGTYDALRAAVNRMLEELKTAKPLPGPLRRAQHVLLALAAQADARDLMASAIERLSREVQTPLTDAELKGVMANLLKAQVALANAGFPVPRQHIQKMQEQLKALAPYAPDPAEFLGDHAEPFDRLRFWAAREEVADEINGGGRPAGAQPNVDRLFGRGDPRTLPAEAFIGHNMEWNNQGQNLAQRAMEIAQAADRNQRVKAELDQFMREFDQWRGRQRGSATPELQALQEATNEALSRPPENGEPPAEQPPANFLNLGDLFGH